MATLAVEFSPNWASAPGETIADLLEERGMPVAALADALEQSLVETNHLLCGRVAISVGMAQKLHAIFGASVEFWVSRDLQYRADAARIDARHRAWLNALPLSDMIRFGWLEPPPRPSDEVDACLQFFGAPSINAWHEMYENIETMAAFRASYAFDSNPAAVAAWLRRGEIEASQANCNSWNPDRFRESLQAVRRVTRERDPARFAPELRSICAESGVAVVIARAPAGCRASGATRFVSPKRAMLLLSCRYLSDDQFWFTFFHEAGHLLLHGPANLFLEGLEDSTVQEREANRFAEEVLIPEQFRRELLDLRPETRSIVRFAAKIGVSPGIVVGQLQQYQRVRPSHFNGLKRRYRWAGD